MATEPVTHWEPNKITTGEAFRTATTPARVGLRIRLWRNGTEYREYIRTFCGNRWGWVDMASGECIDSANVEYALLRGAWVTIV